MRTVPPRAKRATLIANAALYFLLAAMWAASILARGWNAIDAAALAVVFTVGVNDWRKAWEIDVQED